MLLLRMKLSVLPLLLAVTFSACSRQPIYSPPVVENDHVRVDVSLLEADVPRFFTYQFQGKKISFFVMKLGKKVISFLDACASCYNHKRGYQYADSAITCRYCNMQFSLYTLEKGMGGCYPIRIEGFVQDGSYIIPVRILSDSAEKF